MVPASSIVVSIASVLCQGVSLQTPASYCSQDGAHSQHRDLLSSSKPLEPCQHDRAAGTQALLSFSTPKPLCNHMRPSGKQCEARGVGASRALLSTCGRQSPEMAPPTEALSFPMLLMELAYLRRLLQRLDMLFCRINGLPDVERALTFPKKSQISRLGDLLATGGFQALTGGTLLRPGQGGC